MGLSSEFQSNQQTKLILGKSEPMPTNPNIKLGVSSTINYNLPRKKIVHHFWWKNSIWIKIQEVPETGSDEVL